MKLPTIISKIIIDYFRYLAAGVVVIILIVGYLLVIAPKISEVNSSQVVTRQADIDRLKQQQKYLEDLRTSNEKFKQLFSADSLQSLNDFLPTDPDFPGLMLTVKNVIAQSGLSLDSIAVAQGGQTSVAASAATASAASAKTTAANAQAATVGGVSVKTQDVSITISGGKTYETFKSLLTNIEASRRLFDIVSLSFSATNGTGGGASWTMVLRSYYLPATTR